MGGDKNLGVMVTLGGSIQSFGLEILKWGNAEMDGGSPGILGAG